MTNKFRLNKLRNRIWMYFVIFTVLLVCFIWLLQTVFFEYNYQTVKSQTMNSYADIIASEIRSTNSLNEDYVLTLKESGVNVLYVEKHGNVFNFLYPDMNSIGENSPYYQVLSNIVNELSIEENLPVKEEVFAGTMTIYTARKIETLAGTRYLILISGVTSAQETVQVLRNQLISVAVIVCIISLFISYVISSSIAKPVVNMSEVAHKWAKGDDTVKFTAGSYAEMDELAEALNKAKEEVNKTGKLQRDLLANVSHDLKTPLTMIRAYAEMIKDISGENKQKRDKHTKIIIDEADRLALLVNDILDLSKIQSQTIQTEKTEINLSKLVETVIYRFDNVMCENGYKIVKDIAPGVYILADRQKIEQAVYNLIGNAINYTGEDKTVKVYLSTENGVCTLEIIDSGNGIDEEKLQTIWEKYYRYSETHKRTVKGTGLGLSIVKAIWDLHGISYGVLSKVGVGSNFYAKFDIIKIDETENSIDE